MSSNAIYGEETLDDFQALRDKYPRLIKPDFHFECRAGWLSILDRYFADVDEVLPQDVPWSNRQIKEKFGTLRLYCEPLWPGKQPTTIFAVDILNMGATLQPVNSESSEIGHKLLWARWRAEGRSARTCEHCGKPGVVRHTGGWYHTSCEEHAQNGIPVGSNDGVIKFEGKRYRFDAEKDDIVEMDTTAETES